MTPAVREKSYRAFSAPFDSRLGEVAASELARRVYVVAGAFLAVLVAFLVLLAFRASPIWGVTALVVGAVLLPLVVTLMRLGLELLVAVFRIADLTGEIAEHGAEISVNTAALGASTGRVAGPTGERL